MADETLYESTSVPFAEKQFKQAQAFKKKQAEKEDDFSRNLLLANTVVTGANAALNIKADALERSQLPRRMAHQTTIENSAYWRGVSKEINDSGGSRLDFLVQKHYDRLFAEAETKHSNLQTSGYTNALYSEAKVLAEAELPNFNKLLEAAQNAPSLENFDEFYLEHNTLPRDLFSYVAGKTRNVLRRETPETIAAKAQEEIDRQNRELDALAGTSMGEQLDTLRTLMNEVASTTYDSSQMWKGIDERIEAGDILGKFVGNPYEVQSPEETLSNGDRVNTTKMLVSMLTRNGDIVQHELYSKTEVTPFEDAVISSRDRITFTNTLSPEGMTAFQAYTNNAPRYKDRITEEGFFNAIQEFMSTDFKSEYFKDDLDEISTRMTLATTLADLTFDNDLRAEFRANPEGGVVIWHRESGQYVIHPERGLEAEAKGLSYNNYLNTAIEYFNIQLPTAGLNVGGRETTASETPEEYKSFETLLRTEDGETINPELVSSITNQFGSLQVENIPANIVSMLNSMESTNPNSEYINMNPNNPLSRKEIFEKMGINTEALEHGSRKFYQIWDVNNKIFLIQDADVDSATTPIASNRRQEGSWQNDDWLQNIEYGQHIQNLEEQIANSSGPTKENFQETLDALLENPPLLSISKDYGTSWRTYPAGVKDRNDSFSWQPSRTARSFTDLITFEGLTWASSIEEIKTQLETIIDNELVHTPAIIRDAKLRLDQLNSYIDERN